MPELPEVEAARRRVHACLVGRRLVDVVAHDDRIVFDEAPAVTVADSLRGRTVTATGRRGKYHWLVLDRPPHLLVHFGMTGRYHIFEAGAPGAEASAGVRFRKLEMRADDGGCVVLSDPRRLGRVRLREDPLATPPVSELGFDPLEGVPRMPRFADLVRSRRVPLKALLLDQGFAAGVGNWIADEVLYQARLDPHRRACDLDPSELQRLRTRLGEVIRRAVAVDADSDRFPRTWLFHHRWGRQADARTARGEKIEHSTIGGRTTAWVPEVQH